MPSKHEIEDGHDTLAWIAAQSWCDGRIGMWGDSYYGYTQWAAAASGHPALKAIVPRVTSTDFKVLNQWGDSIVLLYTAGYLAECWLDNLMYHFDIDWSVRPLAKVFDEAFATVGKRSVLCDLMMGLGGPRTFVQPPRRRLLHNHRVPVLHSVAWFDNVCPYSFEDYEYLTTRGEYRDLQYLVADATDHEMYHLRHAPVGKQNDHAVDDTALARVITECVRPGLDFFDVFLKGESRESTVPRARWFMGNGGWQTSSCLAATRKPGVTPLSGLTRTGHRQRRGRHAPPRERRGRGSGAMGARSCRPRRRRLGRPLRPSARLGRRAPGAGRGDVLTFTGEPLNEPLDLAGPISACLTLDSTCSSMHVYAKLSDVFPDGSARMLVRGESLLREKD